MPKLFITGIAIFLLLGAGYGAIQAARAIPWDCSDWQAFAHEDRTTAILESLAENRGKTLYCGIDQSDTFTKAETWAAGKDRNERDDTVYWGERGSFRGFIAAQEGWLTEGESGITGQSIATIFEFPRETRRTKKVKRMPIASEGGCPDPEPDQDEPPPRTPGTLACWHWETEQTDDLWGTPAASKAHAMAAAVEGGLGRQQTWTLNWRTGVVVRTSHGGGTFHPAATNVPTSENWQETAQAAARNACRAKGYDTAIGVVWGPGHNRDPQRGANLGWFFQDRQTPIGMPNYRHRARQSRTWTATCKKVIRRNR